MLSCFSHVQLLVTPWTVAHQVLLSMGFSRQEYWRGLPFPSPGDLPGPGIEPRSTGLQANSLRSEPPLGVNSRYQVNSEEHWAWKPDGELGSATPSLAV